ncbi:hypothetical protein [uncultured Flavobacterium sp.]|uniref:hypothetical protein n=1 Tax=uncultured Flavobacterium sp. TaxID=165435 RepID=UPI0030EF1018|tara:strand:+ start:675 stop:1145 length:471 start_codon:yes stop_codon:yes gene_type:complete
MKKIKLIPLLAMIFMLNVASMCSNDDDSNSLSNSDPVPVINTMSQGTWRITFYEDSGENHTNYFTGYNFTFGTSNVLTASNGVDIYTGIWSVTNSDTNDDSPSNDLDFNILFTSPTNFSDELSDDWDILSRTDTKVELVDVSGGNGGTDYLTFEKN